MGKVSIDTLIDGILDSYNRDDGSAHVENFPSRQNVVRILDECKALCFPEYTSLGSGTDCVPVSLRFVTGERVNSVISLLTREVQKAFLYTAHRKECLSLSCEAAFALIEEIPNIRRKVALDAEALLTGDPAAKSLEEVILSYPGFEAILTYRIAHFLAACGVPVIPRIMSEHTHGKTGIDINPHAVIGEKFFIDHGTGIVIGETCIIGNRVKLYQGVTLGALSVSKEMTGKRHPTIEDDVTIYAGATILGGDTVIGRGSTIGGNMWITRSVPPMSTVTQ